MYPNTVAIVGSAGRISDEMREAVEQLSAALAESGFDLLTGGMDGVMRAAARGHARGSRKTRLTSIQPGWGRCWQADPYSHAVVKTEIGTMRNHLVVQSADLVVAIGGGSGTLSEIALAWQMRKPIAALVGHGGWSETLAGQRLDKRRGDAIEICRDVRQVVQWAEQLRPEGAYAGRGNRDLYPLRIPAIHRVCPMEDAGSPEGLVYGVHALFGMTLAFDECVRRLEALDRQVAEWNQAHCADSLGLVTFDDGWKDVLMLRETFRRCVHLQPVVFVGGNHFEDPVRPLPMQRLYHHWGSELQCKEIDRLHSIRKQVKGVPEQQQHAMLDEMSIAAMPSPDWLLTLGDLQSLQDDGWIVGSHGPAHEDLRKMPAAELSQRLQRQADLLERHAFFPWLSWPEGQWSEDCADIARDAGFVMQFGLLDEPYPDAVPDGMAMREIWWPEAAQ